MNYAGPLSSQPPPLLHFPLQASSSCSPFLSFPLSAALSHRTERLTDYCSNITTRYTSFPSISLSLSLTLALSVSLCFIGITNNATFVYPKQPQVGYTAQSNIKEQWKIKKETSMKYTCNNKIRTKMNFCALSKKTITFYPTYGTFHVTNIMKCELLSIYIKCTFTQTRYTFKQIRVAHPMFF